MKTKIKKVTKTTAAKKTDTPIRKKAVTKKTVSMPLVSVITKKVASKKPAVKKNKTTLVVAPNHNSFWLNDGQILNTLTALAGALKTMDNAVYKYHTNLGRHDFANWVEDVLEDIKCATALRKAKTAKSAYTVVAKFLALYK